MHLAPTAVLSALGVAAVAVLVWLLGWHALALLLGVGGVASVGCMWLALTRC